MTNDRPTEPQLRWEGWDIPAIDAAIKVRRAKHAAAIRRNDMPDALAHEGYIDVLLDGRLYLSATRRAE